MKHRKTLNPKESEQFRKAVRDITRLPQGNRLSTRQSTPSPQPRQSEQDERDVLDHLLDHPLNPAMLETGEAPEYRRNGVQLSVMHKLRRGQYACRGELDLHGLSVSQAHEALKAFLKDAQGRGLGCVRVIHGKGLRSSGQAPVLKPRVAAWLRQRNDVLAFCSARPVDGGSGAVYVLLKRG